MDNYEREDKKGNGLFLGIVGVATLIVAIIGASFAYFSIQASSAEGAVNLTAYQFSASLSMSEIYGPGEKGIIPVDPDGTVNDATPGEDDTNLAYAINVSGGSKTRSCLDGRGFGICALYQVTVTNDGTAPLTLDGVVKTISNTGGANDTGFANLKCRLASKSGDYYDIESTDYSLAAAVPGETSIGQITVPAKSGDTPGSYTTYVLIYLDETGDDQSDEMGANFNGQIVFTSNGTSSQLTGTFNIS